MLSYLLFEIGYCSDLIELGYQDAMAKQAELRRSAGADPVWISEALYTLRHYADGSKVFSAGPFR